MTINSSASVVADVITNLRLDFKRPQYVSVPEGFISSLAWKLFDWDRVSADGKLPLALMYKTDNVVRSKYFELISTAPEYADLEAFGEALKSAGIGPERTSSIDLAAAVSNSVAGIRSESGKGQAASPISPGYALLQNMRGVQKAGNPPDLAEILESLYRVGLSTGDFNSHGVADRWKAAADHRLTQDAMLTALDGAAMEALLGHGIGPIERVRHPIEGKGLFPNTPFDWFARSWDRLTSPIWVDALPARVWVDWATTVLRLGVGLGFLWEAAWYEHIGRVLVSGEQVSWTVLREGVPECLPWKSSRGTQSVRDVSSILKWRVHKGTGVRKLLEEWLSDNAHPEMTFTDGWHRMTADHSFIKKLTGALRSREQPGTNSWEAIKYALQTRDTAGPYADYYGMLRQNGRFLTVEPGTEWIAVVASLSCQRPQRETNVGELMSDFRDMGLSPELSDVVQLLERAGLARGSADADQGVIIRSAFETGN